jgi:hypothetical protein
MQERHLNTTLKSLSPQSQCPVFQQRKTNASEDVGKMSLSIMLLGMSTSVTHTLFLGISTSATVIGNVNKNQSYTAIGNVNECHCYGNHMEAHQIKKESKKSPT